MRLTRRAFLAVVPATALTACAMPGQDDDDPPLADGPLTLLQIERDAAGTPLGLVHLRIDPANDGDNDVAIWLTDLYGGAMSAPVSARATSLADGSTIERISLDPGEDGHTGTVDLAPEGWWQVDVTVERETGPTTASFHVLLPDPNIHGSDAVPTPDESADARAIYDRAIATMASAPHLRWSESINTGADTMVAIDFIQIAATTTSPQAVEQYMRYSGTFAEREDGNPLPPPKLDSFHTITIGDEGWVLTTDGTAATAPPTTFAPIAEWGAIYAAAKHIALGPTADIDGETTQVISFYSPEYNGQSQAWFAWWVGIETGRVHRIAMLARAHYMIWSYSDFDADLTIERPLSTPQASPAAG
jgi:hypothetical protein